VSMVDRATLAALLCITLGCGGRQTATTSDSGLAASEGAAPGNAKMQEASVEASPFEHDAASDAGAEFPAPSKQPTVWIGQVDPSVTWAAYDGGDTVVASAPSEPIPPEKVVLILKPLTNPVEGTITFGDLGPPPPATDPKQSYPPKPILVQDAFGTSPFSPDEDLAQSPYPGFSYSLVSSDLSGNLLHLGFVPSEIWRDWCAIQNPMLGPPMLADGTDPCACDGGVCRAPSTPSQRIDLTVTGNTMQGQMLGSLYTGGAISGGGTPPTLRLQRVQ
jgi:hypothetical protein